MFISRPFNKHVGTITRASSYPASQKQASVYGGQVEHPLLAVRNNDGHRFRDAQRAQQAETYWEILSRFSNDSGTNNERIWATGTSYIFRDIPEGRIIEIHTSGFNMIEEAGWHWLPMASLISNPGYTSANANGWAHLYDSIHGAGAGHHPVYLPHERHSMGSHRMHRWDTKFSFRNFHDLAVFVGQHVFIGVPNSSKRSYYDYTVTPNTKIDINETYNPNQ